MVQNHNRSRLTTWRAFHKQCDSQNRCQIRNGVGLPNHEPFDRSEVFRIVGFILFQHRLSSQPADTVFYLRKPRSWSNRCLPTTELKWLWATPTSGRPSKNGNASGLNTSKLAKFMHRPATTCARAPPFLPIGTNQIGSASAPAIFWFNPPERLRASRVAANDNDRMLTFR